MEAPAPTSTAVEVPARRATPPDALATNAPLAAPTHTARKDVKPPPEPVTTLVAAAPDQGSAPIDDASILHIDAGPVFNEVIAKPSAPGFDNQLGDAHRALERETRNDGWAYTMEGEIQNAMVNETSTGAFRADHVECRATLCEVRLSGKYDQAAAIKRWSEGLGVQPFGQRLFLNYSSSISNNERVDSIMIFRRPPATPR
jgi:hypothetical protein